MQVYKDVPRFLLMHQGLLSHDDINLVEVEDADLAETLMEMHKSGEYWAVYLFCCYYADFLFR